MVGTRGSGRSTSERELVIEHREALIFMICEAADIEHAVICEYLFAACSLKERPAEGLTTQQMETIDRWRATILGVAGREMLHLALTANMLTALGASPHLSRPNLPQPVSDLSSATVAIEAIVEQGEGPRGDWRDSHFGRFKRVLDEYLAMRAADPAFEPARPVIAARVRRDEGDAGGPLIGETLTARAADLFNVVYEVLLQVLYRLLAYIDESESETAVLADVAVGLMYDGIEPLGRMLGTMPVGPEHPGTTAGARFELF